MPDRVGRVWRQGVGRYRLNPLKQQAKSIQLAGHEVHPVGRMPYVDDQSLHCSVSPAENLEILVDYSLLGEAFRQACPTCGNQVLRQIRIITDL